MSTPSINILPWARGAMRNRETIRELLPLPVRPVARRGWGRGCVCEGVRGVS